MQHMMQHHQHHPACQQSVHGGASRWLQQQRRPSALRAAKQSRNVSASNQSSILQPSIDEAVQFLQSKLGRLAHTFVGATSAHLQGAHVPDSYASSVQVSVQWDALQPLHQQMVQEEQVQLSPIAQLGRGRLGFSVQRQGLMLQLQADRNTVVAMDANRVQVSDPQGSVYWCESLLAVKQGAPPDLAAAVDDRLQQMQAELTATNAQVGEVPTLSAGTAAAAATDEKQRLPLLGQGSMHCCFARQRYLTPGPSGACVCLRCRPGASQKQRAPG